MSETRCSCGVIHLASFGETSTQWLLAKEWLPRSDAHLNESLVFASPGTDVDNVAAVNDFFFGMHHGAARTLSKSFCARCIDVVTTTTHHCYSGALQHLGMKCCDMSRANKANNRGIRILCHFANNSCLSDRESKSLGAERGLDFHTDFATPRTGGVLEANGIVSVC